MMTIEIAPYGGYSMAGTRDLDMSSRKIVLNRIRLEKNERRFYAFEITADIFGCTLLSRNWGRIGTPGRLRLDPHPSVEVALTALQRMEQSKRRRGYLDNRSQAISVSRGTATEPSTAEAPART
jgi:predicted DNA-binding WGR domain protein